MFTNKTDRYLKGYAYMTAYISAITKEALSSLIIEVVLGLAKHRKTITT